MLTKDRTICIGRRSMIGLFLFSFCVYMIAAWILGNRFSPETWEYEQLAQNMLSGRGFGMPYLSFRLDWKGDLTGYESKLQNCRAGLLSQTAIMLVLVDYGRGLWKSQGFSFELNESCSCLHTALSSRKRRHLVALQSPPLSYRASGS